MKKFKSLILNISLVTILVLTAVLGVLDYIKLQNEYAIAQRGGNDMKILRIALWILISIIFMLGILYFFVGSLETFPTPEQQEEARIASFIMIIVSAISGLVLLLSRKKYRGDGDEQ